MHTSEDVRELVMVLGEDPLDILMRRVVFRMADTSRLGPRQPLPSDKECDRLHWAMPAGKNSSARLLAITMVTGATHKPVVFVMLPSAPVNVIAILNLGARQAIKPRNLIIR